MVGEHTPAMTPGRHGVVQHQTEAVHTGVRHTKNPAHLRRKIRLQAQRLGHVNFLRVNTSLAATHDKLFNICGVVLRRKREKTFGFLDALPADTTHDHVFFNTFAGRFIVIDDIARSAVQQTMKA